MTSQSRSHSLFTACLAGLVVLAGCTGPAAPPPEPAPKPAAAATSSPHAGMAMDGDHHTMDPNAPMAQATGAVSGTFGNGQPVSVSLQVTDMMSGKAMPAEAFEVAHTERMHVLALDPSLVDYSHVHAQPGAQPGEWTFAFTPRFNRPYRIWLDVKPVGGVQAFVPLLLNAKAPAAPVDKTLSQSALIEGLSAHLRFDGPLKVGEAVMGHLELTRGGKAFAQLEPVMGTYAHIVGVSEDWSTVAHVHPMGAEPHDPKDRGGPAVDFHLEPKRPGFLKLFAQVRVNGRDVFFPFGVRVDAAPTSGASPKP